ncbi:MAG: Gfo/Idh/MocA family oxidoreductase [Leeuwenhoekiella sp.]
MKNINWGIIGCGDVAEVKSGPAFSRIANSHLLSVMRRDATKAADFAKRHKVPEWHSDADHLIQDPNIQALYIATPPSTHLEYALKAIEAGKYVYLEKPVTLNAKEAVRLCEAVKQSGGKLTVAHYRRQLPAFLKVGELLSNNAIGDVRCAKISIIQPLESSLIRKTKGNWRLDASLSGGGYFHDIAPHQLDLMLNYFGDIKTSSGHSGSLNTVYAADDIVLGSAIFKNDVFFNGVWAFNASVVSQEDNCTIYGSEGAISFSFYGEEVHLNTPSNRTSFKFKNPKHIQEPMIAATVDYFLDKGPNPCPAHEALTVMKLMDSFTNPLLQ